MYIQCHTGSLKLVVFGISVAIVQLLSHVQLFATPWTAACQASLKGPNPMADYHATLLFCSVAQSSLTLSDSLSLSPGNLLKPCPLSWWCYPTILSSAILFSFAFSLSQDQGLLSELALCIRWLKYWSFRFSVSPSSEYSGLISFRIDWFTF